MHLSVLICAFYYIIICDEKYAHVMEVLKQRAEANSVKEKEVETSDSPAVFASANVKTNE